MTMTTDANVERLEAVRVSGAPIADYGQVFSDEHLAARDFFWDAPHRVAGSARQLGSPHALIAAGSAGESS